jgi:hypothetical protein
MAKKKPGKTETSPPVVKQTLTKSALINLIAEQNDIPRKTAIGWADAHRSDASYIWRWWRSSQQSHRQKFLSAACQS